MMRWFRREEGSTAIETAFSCTVILVLFIGIMEMTQVLFAYHYISEAARVATRYAAVRGYNCTGKGMTNCPATSDEIQTYIRSLTFPGITPSKLIVTTTWPTTGTACTPASTPCNNPGNLVNTQVTYSQSMGIPFVPAFNVNMSSTSQMVISQ